MRPRGPFSYAIQKVVAGCWRGKGDPDQVKGKDDYFEIIGTLSAEQAYGKPGQFGCNLQKK